MNIWLHAMQYLVLFSFYATGTLSRISANIVLFATRTNDSFKFDALR